MEVRLAIIGTFWLSKTFLQAMDRTEGVRLAAVCSRQLEKAREFAGGREGVKLYDDPDLLAEDTEIDAVYIATPNVTHFELSKRMLQAGKHVLCEKPITCTIAQYNELRALANEKHLIYMEAMMSAHLPQIAALKQTLATLGKTVCARFDFCQRSSKIDAVRRGERFSTFRKDCYGGALMDLGVYAVYLSLMLFGYPRDLQAFATPVCDVDGSDTVILFYDGFHVVITLSKLAESRIRSEIICEGGTVTVGLISQLQEMDLYPVGGEKISLYGKNDFADSMTGELRDFLSYIAGEDDREMQALAKSSVKLLSEIREKIGYDRF
ncbi:MAG: Gfo/Idh/MocA family oxidoreductase [Ruminococcaceae bacterium]|nr:Gfo/Idh/MocA family oxidoreductase [Oscillospiraceae bacterium]